MNGVIQLKNVLLFPAGILDSCRYASLFLNQYGIPLTDHPTPDITHLLLDIPSFDAAGALQDGTELKTLLRMLPESITIIGGNLSAVQTGRNTLDLLKDEFYLTKNALITAECALRASAPYLHTTYSDSPALILGWGRIGKQLARLLRSLGCSVTVAARNESDRALLESFGYNAADYCQIPKIFSRFRILFNTVPVQLLDRSFLDQWKDCIKIDLASYPGMICENVITARGLPGKYAPESSGRLIAQTICRLIKENRV